MIQAESIAGSYPTTVTNGNHELIADAPIAKGGGSSGFGAHELLEAALAACLNMAVRMCASANGIPLQSVRTRVSLQRPTDDIVRFGYAVELTGPLSEQQRAELEFAAQTCPVRQTLSKQLDFEQMR